MKVLISSIGSRSDVQPLLALALELRALGHSASLCVAPNFKDWVESFGLACVPMKMGSHYSQSLPAMANRFLWMRDERRWNVLFRATLNEERTKTGLAPIRSVHRYIFTNRPWLAADPALAPAPSADGMQIVQTGAWFLSDQTSLPDYVEKFLANGEPPIYFGFGSMRAPEQTSRLLIEAARALGRRSIISQGWANLSSIDAGPDCISIGDVNHEKLFRRVAAIEHLTTHAMVSTLRECLRPEMTARVQVRDVFTRL